MAGRGGNSRLSLSNNSVGNHAVKVMNTHKILTNVAHDPITRPQWILALGATDGKNQLSWKESREDLSVPLSRSIFIKKGLATSDLRGEV